MSVPLLELEDKENTEKELETVRSVEVYTMHCPYLVFLLLEVQYYCLFAYTLYIQ